MKNQISLMPFIAGSLIMTLIFTAAAEAQPNLGVSLLDQFTSRTSGWWKHFQEAALFLFKLTATLEVCLFGLRMVLQKASLNEIAGQFVLVLIFMGFIATVILNYEEWAKIIAITGLKPLASTLSGNSFNAGSPVAMIFKFMDAMVPVLKDAGLRDIGMVMIYVFCMAAIIAVFAIICCQYIIIVCEFHIVANAALILIGLAGTKILKDYALNVVKYVLAVGVKLFVLTLILNIGFDILSLADPAGSLQGQSIKNISIGKLVETIIQGVILLALAKTLPQTCAGILSGSAAEGGNPLRAIAGAVAGATAGAVMAAGTSLNNVRMANKLATQAGATGFKDRFNHIRETLGQAKMNQNPSSIKNQLKQRLSDGKMTAKS